VLDWRFIFRIMTATPKPPLVSEEAARGLKHGCGQNPLVVALTRSQAEPWERGARLHEQSPRSGPPPRSVGFPERAGAILLIGQCTQLSTTFDHTPETHLITAKGFPPNEDCHKTSNGDGHTRDRARAVHNLYACFGSRLALRPGSLCPEAQRSTVVLQL